MIAFQPMRLGQVPLRQMRRRHSLGAEELVELGDPRQMGSPNTGLPSPQTVTISAAEAKLMLKVVDNIVAFSDGYAIEFQSYCPPERWQKALEDVGTWSREIKKQLDAKATEIALPADVVFRLIDLEKCVSYARDARLSGAKAAFTISAIGAVADFVFGLSWVGTIAYIAGLSILLGQPLIAKYRPDPQAPYAPGLQGQPQIAKYRLDPQAPYAPGLQGQPQIAKYRPDPQAPYAPGLQGQPQIAKYRLDPQAPYAPGLQGRGA